MNPVDPLSELRDIHLPDPVGWWPPAPGWWILALMAVIATIAGARWLLQLWRREAPRRVALKELKRISLDYANHRDPQRLAQELSELLRRFALVRFDPETVAGLTGEHWRAFLDTHATVGRGPVSFGEKMAVAPYCPSPVVSGDDLLRDTRQWLKTAGRIEESLPP